MAHFLVTYHDGGMSDDPAAIAEAQRAFMLWATKAESALTDRGAQVRSTTTMTQNAVLTGSAESQLLGWCVIEAIDAEEAIFILRDHPFLVRGGTFQIHQPAQF